MENPNKSIYHICINRFPPIWTPWPEFTDFSRNTFLESAPESAPGSAPGSAPELLDTTADCGTVTAAGALHSAALRRYIYKVDLAHICESTSSPSTHLLSPKSPLVPLPIRGPECIEQ